MSSRGARLQDDVERRLWPSVERLLDGHGVAGIAVAVVRDDEVVARGFGVRDVGSREPVTAQTMFHLASVSKPFVATGVVTLARPPGDAEPLLDLDDPITRWIPELVLADGRASEVTARGLLTHTSGLPDVTDYGWHDPQLDDDALARFAASLTGWRLKTDPGTDFSYSNTGFELLGLLISRVTGATFEDAMRQLVLLPYGMGSSTFRRSEVPPGLAASPHVGMPLTVPDVYPYTRRHAPSSSLHSNLDDLCRWMQAHLAVGDAAGGQPGHPQHLDPGLREAMWRPAAEVGEPPWEEQAGFGWLLGHHEGHALVGHSGADPGFGSRLVLVPESRTGVVVLANSNTVPTATICAAALDIALGTPSPSEAVATLGALLPSVAVPVAEALAAEGPDAARSVLRRAAATEPPEHDLDDEGFSKAVWGAIELHRTQLVRPLLGVWTEARPDSSEACTMTGWAHQVEGRPDLAREWLERALELDPDNDDATLILGGLPSV